MWVPPLVSELPYPSRRAPRLFLVVRAARKRCGAHWVCLRLGAAVSGSASQVPLPLKSHTTLLYAGQEMKFSTAFRCLTVLVTIIASASAQSFSGTLTPVYYYMALSASGGGATGSASDYKATTPSTSSACGNLGIRQSVLGAMQRASQVLDPVCVATCLSAGYVVTGTSNTSITSFTSAYTGSSCTCWTGSGFDQYLSFNINGNTNLLNGNSFSQAWLYTPSPSNPSNYTSAFMFSWQVVDISGNVPNGGNIFCSAYLALTAGSVLGFNSPVPSPPLPPPPLPSSPPLPPPLPPSPSTMYLSASLTLVGYTVSTFGTAQAVAFNTVIAAMADTTASSVTITSVAAASGRHLLLTGVTVAFSVATSTPIFTTSLLNNQLANPTAVATAFQGGGLTACTGVVVAVSPATTATVPVATTSLPSTTTTTTTTSSALKAHQLVAFWSLIVFSHTLFASF
jgi:hypothetical protein